MNDHDLRYPDQPDDDFDAESLDDFDDLPVIPVLPDDEETESLAFHAPQPSDTFVEVLDAEADETVEGDDGFGLPDLDRVSSFGLSPLDDVDIEAALASVATLSDTIAEQEAQEQAERAREEAERRHAEEEAARRASYYLPRPPMMRVQRGSVSSVIPAFMLMALGAGLTLALSAPDVTLTFSAIVLIALGAGAVLMIAQWLSSGRWAAGALFLGTTILACIGVMVFLAQDETLGAAGWPLLLSGVGLAALMSALLAPAVHRWQVFVGIALIVAGGVGTVVTGDLLEVDFAAWMPILSAALGVSAVLLLIAPIFARK